MMTRRAPVLVIIASLAGTPVAALAGIVAASFARVAVPSAIAAATPPTKGALYSDGQGGRYLLAGEWLYRADPRDLGVAGGWWRDLATTAGWSPVSVPNSYNAGDLSRASMTGSVGWYRRDFTLPAGAFAAYVPLAARHWIIRFESVNYYATVWLNGRKIGTHAGAYLPFEFDLSGLRPGVNRLIVRVDDRRSPSDLPPGPSGGWWNFGGLGREVYLRAAQAADIEQVAVRPELPCPHCAATIKEQALIRNVTATPEHVTLRGVYGNAPIDFGSRAIPPRATWTATASVRILHPRLWSIDHPSLYPATLTLSDSRRRPLGSYFTASGIRRIAVTRDGRLELNWRLLNLRGLNLHEQDIVEGAALDPAHLSRLVNWVREAGGRIIRAHYPLNPEIEELADRDGILLWSEIPVYQVASHYLRQPGWLASAHAMLRDNILTNENHPSVLVWSIGNELQTPAPAAEATYIAGAAALAHRLDPTRPVGMATSGWPGVPCQTAYAPLEVIGHNDYFGWFDAGGGANDDRDGLSAYLDSLRACYRHQAIFITEFGFEGNRHGPVEERGTYEFQANTTEFHLSVFASKLWLSGAIYFPLQDFAAQPGWGGGNPWPDPPFVQKGLFDIYGNKKPIFPVVSSIYDRTAQIR